MNITSKKYIMEIHNKQRYTVPVIEIIVMDNEISLQLESSPPNGPGEVIGLVSKEFNSNPFKDTLS